MGILRPKPTALGRLFLSIVLISSLFLSTNSNLFKSNADSMRISFNYLSFSRIKDVSLSAPVLQNNAWGSLRENDEAGLLQLLDSLQKEYQAETITFKLATLWQQEAVDRWGEDYVAWHPNECYEALATEEFAQVRDAVCEIAAKCGFDETEIAQISTAAYELAGNIYRYSEKGAVIIRGIVDVNGKKGIEIVGIDKGKGVSEVDMQTTVENDMARWGWGTGSSGYGIGLMKTHMDFYLDSQVDGNMIILKKFKEDFISQAYSENRVFDIVSHEQGAAILSEAIEFLEFTGALSAKEYLAGLAAEGKIKFVESGVGVENLDFTKRTEIEVAMKKSFSEGVIYVGDIYSQPGIRLIEQLGAALELDSTTVMTVSKMFYDWQQGATYAKLVDSFSRDAKDINIEILNSIRSNGLVGGLEEDKLFGILVERELEIPVALYWGYYGMFPAIAERTEDAFDLYSLSEDVQRRLRDSIVCVTVDDGSIQFNETTFFQDYLNDPANSTTPVDFDRYEEYEDIPFDRDMVYRPISFEHSVEGEGIPFEKVDYILVPEDLLEFASQFFPREKIVTVGYVEKRVHFTVKDAFVVYTLGDDYSQALQIPDYESALIDIMRERGERLFIHGVKMYDEIDRLKIVGYMQEQRDMFFQPIEANHSFIELMDAVVQENVDATLDVN
jgi:anti-sigma regulatory factor (Ser/Thr protein kinase)